MTVTAIGKVRYVGPSFGVGGLTDGQVYDVTEIDQYGLIRIVDNDSFDEDADGYLYSPTIPGPCDNPKIYGKWEIVEDCSDGKLRELILA